MLSNKIESKIGERNIIASPEKNMSNNLCIKQFYMKMKTNFKMDNLTPLLKYQVEWAGPCISSI